MEPSSIFNNLVDLHLHLGSSSSPHFLWELAHEQGIRLPEKDYWKFIHSVTITKKTTYDNYLKFFDLTERIQSSTYAIEKAVYHAISSAYRKANVTTLEIRFNPMLRNKGGEQDLDKIIFSALVGMKKACLDYPVKSGIILMMDRRFDKRKNEIIAKKAIRFKQDGVVGIDLAGPIDTAFKMDDIVKSVELVKASGIKVTIHTGEITPSKEIWEVVEKLEPDRIGHGIRAVDDAKLLDVISKKKIVLELCPTSNLRTQAVKNMKEIEKIIQTLKKHHVVFTINSDGPELLQTDVKRELELLIQNCVLNREEVLSIIRFARKASFIPL